MGYSEANRTPSLDFCSARSVRSLPEEMQSVKARTLETQDGKAPWRPSVRPSVVLREPLISYSRCALCAAKCDVM
jgi:hypothetical protein